MGGEQLIEAVSLDAGGAAVPPRLHREGLLEKSVHGELFAHVDLGKL
jgi:hypothetical protein